MTTPTTVQAQIQLRADTAANWTAQNPTLLAAELGLETDTNRIKIGNGSTAWNSLAYFPFVVSGGTVLGNLEIGTTGTLTFEGSTADGFETTLAVANPTADRTITLPNQSGTVIVSGNASIVDADIAANAEIAVSKLADGAARQLLQTDAAGTGVEWTDNVDVPGTLDVTGAATFDDDVTIEGDLTVNGTTTTIDTETLLVKDKNIELAVVDTPTDTTADGGGITLKGTTDKTITWSDTTNAWTSSEIVNLPAGTASLPSLIFAGDVNSGLYSPGADQVAIATNGTERARIDSSGRVGIGTSSLTYLLTADSGATNTPFLAKSSATDNLCFINLAAADTPNDFSVRLGATGSNMLFRTGNTERARIDSSGRLLIGTSNAFGGFGYTPQSQVVGSSANTASILVQGTGVPAYPTFARINAGDTAVAANDVLFEMRAYGYDGSNQIRATLISAAIDGTPNTNSMPGRLVFSTTADGAATPTERLRITSAGDIAVGNTSPSAKLDIQATGTSTAIQRWRSNMGVNNRNVSFHAPTSDSASEPFYWSTGNSYAWLVDDAEVLRIDSSGLIGIGVSSPSARLHVKTSSQFDPSLARTTTGLNIEQTAGTAGNGAYSTAITLSKINSSRPGGAIATVQTSTDEDQLGLAFLTHAGASSNDALVEAMRITHGGSMLIGTSTSRTSAGITPNLQVEGTSGGTSSLSLIRNSDNAFSPYLIFSKSRGTTVNSVTTVALNDELGSIVFTGANGTDLSSEGAFIRAIVDAEPTTSADTTDMPTKIVIGTSPNGAAAPEARLTVKSSGIINFSNAPTYADNSAALAGGLVAGDVYRKSDGTLMITY